LASINAASTIAPAAAVTSPTIVPGAAVPSPTIAPAAAVPSPTIAAVQKIALRAMHSVEVAAPTAPPALDDEMVINTSTHKKEYMKLARAFESNDPSIGAKMSALFSGSLQDHDFFEFVSVDELHDFTFMFIHARTEKNCFGILCWPSAIWLLASKSCLFREQNLTEKRSVARS
jgi:hypothetical protein